LGEKAELDGTKSATGAGGETREAAEIGTGAHLSSDKIKELEAGNTAKETHVTSVGDGRKDIFELS